MTIREIIKYKDIDTYRRLKNMCRRKKKEIRLGDKPERLMQHDSYKRCGRRIKQRGWG
ncbi:hypothetical protein KQH90_02000 [Anaerosalibacter bizertensis]|uniref:hypothetical protein n=1 Tax=Anaerosalibacter bizertensis TaxID=932217 RepID=UPI001C0EE026|nr:hypothetical protein [Anaerosalibacter bizertensis]MBU5292810.1 hypothetical protein [Anaerosalibacter bizertensis]